MSSATLQNLSSDLAAAAEAVGPSVVAVHAQHRIPTSGIQWRKDVIVTVNHRIRRNEDISVFLGPEKSVPLLLREEIHRPTLRFLSSRVTQNLRCPK